MDPREIIKKPIVTEKSTRLMEMNKYCFVVDRRASKIQIKDAIETIFNVRVLDVNTMRMLGKLKRMGRHEGRRPNWKKAIVTLEPGSRIEYFEGV
ncbi:MAG TPA: 50S ribosomal protein L23 [Firmicutes bacterium]|jgi:large subunit ribosomal protein L23|nr:50S ribosomal protein L23 [Bacillota bacterium]HBR27888.1 50S ribosomal protein L23 [Bacillota bacterium]HBR35459.1 50S ribosomal protein L23 [Bacillota bacterium]